MIGHCHCCPQEVAARECVELSNCYIKSLIKDYVFRDRFSLNVKVSSGGEVGNLLVE